LETSLLAMTIITDEMWAHLDPCGSWLASDAACEPTDLLLMHPAQL
jgi:hypothetical protein